MLGKIKENWAKYLALAIVAIFILFGASWKEYKGEGFSIKYPRSWTLVREAEKSPTVNKNFEIQELLVIGNIGPGQYFNKTSPRFVVSVYRVPKKSLKISTEDLATIFMEDNRGCPSLLEQSGYITLGRNKAFRASSSCYYEVYVTDTFYLVDAPQNLYVLESSVWVQSSLIPKLYPQILEKIISNTFSVY